MGPGLIRVVSPRCQARGVKKLKRYLRYLVYLVLAPVILVVTVFQLLQRYLQWCDSFHPESAENDNLVQAFKKAAEQYEDSR